MDKTIHYFRNKLKEAFMSTIKAIFAGLLATSLSIAAISGKVTDTSGTIAISGALVQLEKGGQSVTTGPDGLFSLPGSTENIPGKSISSLPQNLFATIRNGLLWVNIVGKSTVVVSTFDLNGKALSSVRRTMEAGTHSIMLPNRVAGLCLCKVKTGNREIVLKAHSVDGVLSRGAVYIQGSSSNKALAKQVVVTAAINDVIVVTKAGYLNYRVAVNNSDTGVIEIKLIVCADTVRDADGNLYHAVRIGNQVWTVENLRTTKYNDGSLIPLDTSIGFLYVGTKMPKYCYYRNNQETTNADSIKKYGALYNWFVVNPENLQKITPVGWHVPSNAEWDTLRNYLIANGYNYDGTTTGDKIAKSLAAQTDWVTSTGAGTIGNDPRINNRSGFSALPGGNRDLMGLFFFKGAYGIWWSTTEFDASSAHSPSLSFKDSSFCADGGDKSRCFSVRLVRDSI
jgi:uncharacterized protein (TIGR02145 family)